MRYRYHFVNASLTPEQCFVKNVRKCPHGVHYEDFFELTAAVKAREDAYQNKFHRLGSTHINHYTQQSYQVRVDKTAPQEEIDLILFYLDCFREVNAPDQPIYCKEEEETYLFWFDSISSTNGLYWNTEIFPDVTWVEDYVYQGQTIPYIIVE